MFLSVIYLWVLWSVLEETAFLHAKSLFFHVCSHPLSSLRQTDKSTRQLQVLSVTQETTSPAKSIDQLQSVACALDIGRHTYT